VFAVNVRSHFLGCKHAVPVMPRGGAIVLVSSLAALIPVSDRPAYNASKAALLGLCHAAAKEAAPRGVRVNVLLPGLIDTPLGRRASAGRPERATTPIPLGRQGTAWDVAAAALFLVSEDAGYVTGQSLVVDGGLVTLR
jgi:NAD(P)-dependent dehydrogenase (short-subunit alcohol dehydrogenase family)